MYSTAKYENYQPKAWHGSLISVFFFFRLLGSRLKVQIQSFFSFVFISEQLQRMVACMYIMFDIICQACWRKL